MALTAADTAYAIAVVRAEESAQPEPLFDDPYAKLFPGPHAAEGTERFLALPFFREGIRLRTRFIDDVVRASHADHVVLLGSGFDMRAHRMPELARATVQEVDFPEQLATKRAILHAAGVAIPANVSYVPFDFAAPGFALDVPAGALFVWEGVIGYIDLDAIDRTLAFIAHRSGRVVFNYGDAIFEPSTAAEHVRRAGFSSFEQTGGDELWSRYLAGVPHPAATYMRLGVGF